MPDPALDLCICGHVRIDHNNPIGGKCRFPSGCGCLLFERATPLRAYSDPEFTPGMVVADLDGGPDDRRTWEYAATGEGDNAFYALWTETLHDELLDRPDLPARLGVVNPATGKVQQPEAVSALAKARSTVLAILNHPRRRCDC